MATTSSENTIFPKGPEGPKDYFTGTTWVNLLLPKDKNNDFSIANVVFEAGARTNWHTHPRGQVLLVLQGDGFYQEKGKPAQALKNGDVVNIPENVEHWHGAAPGNPLVHIAISNYKGDENVVWLDPVTYEEYNSANAQVSI